MNKFTIELIASNKVLKHALMFNRKCVCCFSNKRHAARIMTFLKWHEIKWIFRRSNRKTMANLDSIL